MATRPEPTWELVLKRNSVERLKREKSPLGMLDEVPALIAAGYESVPEEDLVRLKWWGLYHDKPKIGTFMLRIKLPGGRLGPRELRAIGEISNRFGRGDGELSTRQNVQLHWLELAALPDVFELLHAAGLTSAGACGDAVRNITGCPVPRISRDLGVFVPTAQALPFMRALLDAWKEDLRYRVSRVKARMKFMVDDYGPEGIRAEVERRLGYALDDFETPPSGEFSDH